MQHLDVLILNIGHTWSRCDFIGEQSSVGKQILGSWSGDHANTPRAPQSSANNSSSSVNSFIVLNDLMDVATC